jgi:hypothetical protein
MIKNRFNVIDGQIILRPLPNRVNAAEINY